MKKLLIIFIVFVMTLVKCIAINQNYVIKPQIIRVIDGDTVKIWMKENNFNVRLTGIDCYETSPNNHIKYQRKENLSDEQIIEMGQKAKSALTNVLNSNPNIYLEITGVDKKYGRIVGVFYYKDKYNNLVDINNKMLQTGYCPKFIYKSKRY